MSVILELTVVQPIQIAIVYQCVAIGNWKAAIVISITAKITDNKRTRCFNSLYG